MRNCAWLAAFLVISALSTFSQGTDEWGALDKSLQNIKSIHPQNGFVPDDTVALNWPSLPKK